MSKENLCDFISLKQTTDNRRQPTDKKPQNTSNRVQTSNDCLLQSPHLPLASSR